MGLLDGEIADIIGSEMAFLFLDAVLERDVPGTIVDPADPPAPTTVQYTCKAIEQQYSTGVMAGGLVDGGDIEVLILATSIAVEPKNLDRITIRGKTVTVVPSGGSGKAAVTSDPAKATWSCRCTI